MDIPLAADSISGGNEIPLAWSGKKSPKLRSIIAPDYGRKANSPISNAAVWAFPWSLHNYPGLHRAIGQMLGRPEHPQRAFALFRSWHRPGYRVPLWAMERVREYVAARIEHGLQVLAALDAEIASREGKELVRRNSGFTVVREDGRDRRGNWRK